MDDRSTIFSQFLKQVHERQFSEHESNADALPQRGGGGVSAPRVIRSGRKRLILSASSKGGVGKSYVSVNLIEWLQSLNVPLIAFDPDWSNSTLTRFYGKSEFLDISESIQLDNVIRAFERTDLVVADGVGSLQMKFIDWLEDTRVFEMREELGLDITLVVIIEEDKETVFQAGQMAKRVGSRANWLVVRNLKTSPVTEIYDSSNARKELLALGAREITVERLPWNLNSVLQKSSKSIGELIADEGIFFLERQRLRSYQQRMFEEFATARDVLLPSALLETPAEVDSPAGVAAGAEADAAPTPAPPARPRVPPEEV